jgi:hypothetical protein
LIDDFPLLFGPTDDVVSELSQLESLSLGGFNMRLPPYNDPRFLKLDMEAALVCMSRLHTLTLSSVGFIHDAIRALKVSSSLRLLILHLRPQSGGHPVRSLFYTIPRVPSLQSLLDSNPHLHIRIHCASTKRAWAAHDPTGDDVILARLFRQVAEDRVPALNRAAGAAAAPSAPFNSLSSLVSDRLQLLDELDEHRVPSCQYPLAQPLGLFGETPHPSIDVSLAREQARLEHEREHAEMQQQANAPAPMEE